MKKKKRCILHIGMHKTGTTAIQVFLKNHLPDNGYEYLTCDKLSNHSRCIYTVFSDNPYAHKLHQRYRMGKKEVDRYRQKMIVSMTTQIVESKNDNLIISAEVLSGNIMTYDDIYRLKCYLDELFEDVTVVGYIRKFDEFIISNFQQILHMRKPGSSDFAAFAPNYRAAFEKFYKIFDEKQIILKLYDRDILKNGDVVDDLLDTVGLDIPTNHRINSENNKSLTYYGLKLLAIYRYFGEQDTVGREEELRSLKLIEKLSELNGPKVRLSQKEIDRIVNLKKDDIEWIAKKIETKPLSITANQNAHEINSINELFKIDYDTYKKLYSLNTLHTLPKFNKLSINQIVTILNSLK